MEANGQNRIELVDIEGEIQSKALLPLQTAKTLQVTSEAELKTAAEMVRILKELQDEVDKVFGPIVEQAYKAHKAAKRAQNEHLKPLVDAEATIRQRINLFLSVKKAEREKAETERRRAEASLRQQPASQPERLAPATVAPPRLPEVPAAPKVVGVSEVLDWKWKVVDVAQIPAQYWVLDETLINAEVRTSKELTRIPGIEVFSESRAVVKR
jgi:hypothetical protein